MNSACSDTGANFVLPPPTSFLLVYKIYGTDALLLNDGQRLKLFVSLQQSCRYLWISVYTTSWHAGRHHELPACKLALGADSQLTEGEAGLKEEKREKIPLLKESIRLFSFLSLPSFPPLSQPPIAEKSPPSLFLHHVKFFAVCMLQNQHKCSSATQPDRNHGQVNSIKGEKKKAEI